MSVAAAKSDAPARRPNQGSSHLSTYAEAVIIERLTRVEERIMIFSQNLIDHASKDEEDYREIKASLSSLDHKIDQIIFEEARRKGREDAARTLSKFEGGKWGAIVGGFIAGIVLVVKSFLGHP